MTLFIMSYQSNLHRQREINKKTESTTEQKPVVCNISLQQSEHNLVYC